MDDIFGTTSCGFAAPVQEPAAPVNKPLCKALQNGPVLENWRIPLRRGILGPYITRVYHSVLEKCHESP